VFEWVSGYLIQGDNIYKHVGMMDGNHPLMEFDGDLGYQIRKQAMTYGRSFDFTAEGNRITDASGRPMSTKVNFTNEEGIIRSEHGDIVVNSLGFRGPYFKKNKPPDTFRIVAMGGSTTAGMYENELTYPRLLERMLNRSSTGKRKIEVINAGVWGYTSCQVAKRYKKEIIDLKPDLILLMSGWNDINKLRASSIKRKSQYCMSHHPRLVQSNVFRFLRLKIKENFNKSSVEPGDRVFNGNIKFYMENLREIIEGAKINKTDVVLVSLPGLYEGRHMDNFSGYAQFNGLSSREINYRQKVLILINSLKRKLAEDYKHVFYVDNGLSPLTAGKSKFFADTVHPTGAGNRVLAFQLFKYLNERYKFGETFNENCREESWSRNKLELEYLKSIFASNRIEDLSFSGCLALHEGICTNMSTSEKFYSVRKYIYVTGTVEFVLGSVLQYPFAINNFNVKKLLEGLMKKSIEANSDFSLSHWVFGTLYSTVGENDLAGKYLDKAYKMNPLLKGFSLNLSAFFLKEKPLRSGFIL
jgi:lysophospholipase L1-like esterase